MPIRIKISDNNKLPQAIANIDKLNGAKAKVGYFKDGDITMIAAVQEFGLKIAVTPKMRAYLHSQGLHLKQSTTHIHIPERSFIRTGADMYEKDVVKKAEALFSDVLNGNINPKVFMEALGLELKGKIQTHGRDLSEPPNHPFTIDRKKGSSNPLVDTGLLLRSMEVEIIE